ncbi:sulfurtransferase [Ammoniphilus sp. CFH 90114]|uniref:sulfurtransferase n=1 Tax=Ammoniphilus sp. CFH 90114 TaxID=2493665 RepID=UPI00100FFACD|nr:sulfurtransferase [Ammoniphilus sp. CFH 90114]RXT07969.1 sulfurtransferase [Ammoniphilus sp. CFH 90114]
MLALILGILTNTLLFTLYRRYVPVGNVPCIDRDQIVPREDVLLLDVRDYNIATMHPVKGVLQLPYAYLKRHYGEIERKDIIIVTSDQLLLNLSVRFLRGKGFSIVGCFKAEGENTFLADRKECRAL